MSALRRPRVAAIAWSSEAAAEPPRLVHMVADLDDIETEEQERSTRVRSAPVPHQGRRTWRALLGRLAPFVAALTALLSAACASTGATFRSGVGDAFLERPPYYAGAPAAAPTAGGRIGHLPIIYQRGATQPASFDPAGGRDTPVDALLAEMNAFLDSLAAATGASVRLVDAARRSSTARTSAMTPPDVQFGCVTTTEMPDDDCAERGDSALGRGRQAMRLAVGRPSGAWSSWMDDAMREAGVGHALVLTLEVGQYLPRQRGWRGDKTVELGTGHVVALPWLTSLETPVTVLQLTGALVERDGRVVRIGAEGILAHRTRLLVSAVGGQELLRAEDVEHARSHRRDEIPGQPLAWQAALRELVAQLTGQPGVAVAASAGRR